MEDLVTNSKSKILVTGGTGFIGSHLVRKLLSENHDIVLLKKSNSDNWRIKDLLNKIKIYKVSLKTDFGSIFKKENIQGIIHLAGKYIKNEPSTDEISELNEANIIYPALLLEAAVHNKIRFFINTGTFSEYRLKGTISEDSFIEPYNYYSVTKAAFETILEFYASMGRIRAISLKLFSPYGEKDNPKIVPLLLESFIKRKTLALTKGTQKLCFTHISDIIDAYIKSVSFLHSRRYKKYETFNIGGNMSYSIREIVLVIEQIAGKPARVKFGKVKLPNDESIKIKCDTSKAKKMLKWQPKLGIREGLERTYKYYKNFLKE